MACIVVLITMLGLYEHDEKWRICHAVDVGAIAGPIELRPLSDCPIDMRIEAIPFLRELHQAVIEAKEKWVPEVDEAIQELKQLCSEIK